MMSSKNLETPAITRNRLRRVDRRRASSTSRVSRRRGSTLIVVIGLLGLLALLGVTFFTFASQENRSAQYFADSAKLKEADASIDPLFDWALQQLVEGANASLVHSALNTTAALQGAATFRPEFFGRHSLLGNLRGAYSQIPGLTNVGGTNVYGALVLGPPHSSPGVQLGTADIDTNNDGKNDTRVYFVDQDGNGIPDVAGAGQDPLNINNSPVATSGSPTWVVQGPLPSPAVDYTYPDINNLFLAYSGYALDPNGYPYPVVIPSFHRPQYLNTQFVGKNYVGGTAQSTYTGVSWVEGSPDTSWPTDAGAGTNVGAVAGTVRQVLRPHPNHVDPYTKVPRFLSAPALNSLGQTVQPFPFSTNGSGGAIGATQGVWSWNRGNGPITPASLAVTGLNTTPSYDIDNDGDGVLEGVWLDLDYPVQQTPDGRYFIPLFSFTVYDADGLINLNAAGNLANITAEVTTGGNAYTYQNVGNLATNAIPSTASNLGLTPSEINPFYALDTDPTNSVYTDLANGGTQLLQYYLFMYNWNSSNAGNVFASRPALANLDLLYLLWGRPDFVLDTNATPGDLHIPPAGTYYKLGSLHGGRWGELSNQNAVYNASANTGLYPAVAKLMAGVPDSTLFPRPGIPAFGTASGGASGAPTHNVPSEATLSDNTGTASVYYGDFGDDNFDRYTGRMLDDGGNPLHDVAIPYANPWYGFNGQYAASSQVNHGRSQNPDPVSGLLIPPFVHPLDFRGGGSYLQNGNAPGMTAGLAQPNTTNPSVWLQYTNYQSMGLVDTAVNAGVGLPAADEAASYFANGPGGVMNQTQLYSLLDDPAESVLEPSQYSQSDHVFDVDEMQGLFLSDTDFSNVGAASRLRDLLLGNFNYSNRRAQIRQRFTTISFDRKNFGVVPSPNRPWEFNADVNNDGSYEFPPVFVPSAAKDANNTFSLGNATFANGNGFTVYSEPFRPELRGLLTVESRTSETLPFGTNQLTLRPQQKLNLNRYLTSVGGYLEYRHLTPHPADPGTAVIPTMIQIMGTDGYPGVKGTDDNSNGIVDDLGELGASGSDDLTPSNVGAFTSAAVQEFWARRDRQILARDVYVLLYTLGGGQNAPVTYADITGAGTPAYGDNSTRALYSDAQCAEMAQFAVNYVDAVDRDDVITIFEYDKNLGYNTVAGKISHGWDLGDNPYPYDVNNPTAIGGDDNPNMPKADKGVVFGIEMQQLTISEALIIGTSAGFASPGTNKNATTYDDRNFTDSPTYGTSAKGRFYSYVELRNTSPFTVNFGNTATAQTKDGSGNLQTNESWRIRVVNSTTPTTTYRIVSLRAKGSTGIPAGSLFTIGSRSGIDVYTSGGTTNTRPSDFRVDYTDANAGPYTTIAPASPIVAGQATAASDPGPGCNLDLVIPTGTQPQASNDNQYFLLADGSNNALPMTPANDPPALVDDTFETSVGGGAVPLTFILERRVHPNRSTKDSAGTFGDTDNPWVQIDQMSSVPVQLFPLQAGDTPAIVASYLPNLKSDERAQPLLRYTSTGGLGESQYGGASTNQLNTVGAINSKSPSPFTAWQPHFDRDLASAIELFSIPLYGPDLLTTLLGQSLSQNMNQSGTQVLPNPLPSATSMSGLSGLALGTELTAAKKFLRPDYIDMTNGGTPPGSNSTNRQYDNRWYRLLEFVEVPTRTHQQLQNPQLGTILPWQPNMNLPVNQQPNLSETAYDVLVQQQVQGRPRTPGKINLNTIRYPQVYAGLIDDDTTYGANDKHHFGASAWQYPGNGNGAVFSTAAAAAPYNYTGIATNDNPAPNTTGWTHPPQNAGLILLPDQLETGASVTNLAGTKSKPYTRNWWQQFLMARDQTDPYGTGLTLPGLPGSRPFRSLSFQGPASLASGGIENTVLRSLPLDINTLGINGTVNPPSVPNAEYDWRHLVEARSAADLASEGGSNQIDIQSRHRLLSKIMGNTTTRSNVFIVYISTAFFEAVPNSGTFQIGAPLAGAPGHRGFFVVDRSDLESAFIFDRASGQTKFDYKQLVKFRQTIQ